MADASASQPIRLVDQSARCNKATALKCLITEIRKKWTLQIIDDEIGRRLVRLYVCTRVCKYVIGYTSDAAGVSACHPAYTPTKKVAGVARLPVPAVYSTAQYCTSKACAMMTAALIHVRKRTRLIDITGTGEAHLGWVLSISSWSCLLVCMQPMCSLPHRGPPIG